MFPAVVLHSFLYPWGISVNTLIKMAIISVILGSFVASCGRANGADGEKAEKSAEAAEDPDAKFYSFTLEPAQISPGAETSVQVTANPSVGYKWNDEYPARFKVTASDGLTVGKAEFKKKDFVLKDKKASLTVPLTAASAGTYSLTLEGGFSVCNETSCKIFRKKTIELKIEAK